MSDLTHEEKEALLEALYRMKQQFEKQREKWERELWKEQPVPCSLAEALAPLKKTELDRIRQSLGLSGLSALKKSELAMELQNRLPHAAKKRFFYYDEERYLLLQAIAQAGGYLKPKNLPIEKIEYYRNRGIIFPALKNGERFLVMPLEILQSFREVDSEELRGAIRRNTEWVRLIHGLLYYYGILTGNQLHRRVHELTGWPSDGFDFFEVLFDAKAYYGQIRYQAGYFCDFRVDYPEALLEELASRDSLPYYPFTKKQLLRAGEEGFVEENSAVKELADFLRSNYGFTRKELDILTRDCTEMIQEGESPTEVMEFLTGRIEIPSLDIANVLFGKVVDLYNHTRQWALKGHTPAELYAKARALHPPLRTDSGETQKRATVFSLQTRSKVGRNDPCPCGSGQKFKKCCGK